MKVAIDTVSFVHVSYPMADDWELIQERIERAAAFWRGELVGSGAGFGQRDLEFQFSSETAAVQFKQDLDETVTIQPTS
jgi:hypothetical protein